MQRFRVRGYHGLGRQQGKTAKNRDWDCASMGLISVPQTMHPGDAYSLGVFLLISLARHTFADGAPTV